VTTGLIAVTVHDTPVFGARSGSTTLCPVPIWAVVVFTSGALLLPGTSS
jgi:hypothetical protein